MTVRFINIIKLNCSTIKTFILYENHIPFLSEAILWVDNPNCGRLSCCHWQNHFSSLTICIIVCALTLTIVKFPGKQIKIPPGVDSYYFGDRFVSWRFYYYLFAQFTNSKLNEGVAVVKRAGGCIVS